MGPLLVYQKKTQ